MNYNFTENFIESIAQVLSAALTSDEKERFIQSVPSVLGNKIRHFSRVNLSKLREGSSNAICKHEKSCKENVIIGFIRSFVVTYLIKYGINLIPALLTGKIFKKPSLFYKLGGKDTISFAMFLSTFISIYKSVLCGLRKLRNKSDSLNSLLAGGAAGMSLMLDSNNSRRRMIALYLSTRTCHFISRGIWRYFVGILYIC